MGEIPLYDGKQTYGGANVELEVDRRHGPVAALHPTDGSVPLVRCFLCTAHKVFLMSEVPQ